MTRVTRISWRMAGCGLADLALAKVEEHREHGIAGRSVRTFHEGSRSSRVHQDDRRLPVTDPRSSDRPPVVRIRVDPWSETAAAVYIVNMGMSGKESSA